MKPPLRFRSPLVGSHSDSTPQKLGTVGEETPGKWWYSAFAEGPWVRSPPPLPTYLIDKSQVKRRKVRVMGNMPTTLGPIACDPSGLGTDHKNKEPSHVTTFRRKRR